MSDKARYDTFTQTEWCLKKVQEAVNDFDIDGIKKYLDMSRLWLGHMREACKNPDEDKV